MSTDPIIHIDVNRHAIRSLRDATPATDLKLRGILATCLNSLDAERRDRQQRRKWHAYARKNFGPQKESRA